MSQHKYSSEYVAPVQPADAREFLTAVGLPNDHPLFAEAEKKQPVDAAGRLLLPVGYGEPDSPDLYCVDCLSGAVVYLVHAWSRLEAAFPSVQLATLNETYAASLPERFTRVREALGDVERVSFEAVALEGKPAELVLSIARMKGADLIVAGTHGRGAMERWLLGSTSAALLHGAECSVLLAPQPPVAERTELVRHMSGTSTVRDPSEWDAELRAFVLRNRDRRTALEVDDPSIGAQVQESGLALVGATYDPRDRQLALMFGGASDGVHLTRRLDHVQAVAVASDPRAVDHALRIESDGGSTLLTFVDEPQQPQPHAPSVNA